MRKLILFISILLFIESGALAQYDWKLNRITPEGIRIYTSLVSNSKIKAVKVNGIFNASISQFVALILDVHATPQWVYHTKSCKLVKQISPQELYYHSEIELPWPLKNRDFVAHLTVSQDHDSKVVTIDGPVVSGWVPVNKDVVRISNSKGKWVLTPLAANKVNIEYILYTDPGGNLPSWLINMFATEGPEHIFKQLQIQLQKSVYKNAKLAFLSN